MNFFFSSRRRHTFFFQAEDGIRDRSPSRGLGDVYKRQVSSFSHLHCHTGMRCFLIFWGVVTAFLDLALFVFVHKTQIMKHGWFQTWHVECVTDIDAQSEGHGWFQGSDFNFFEFGSCKAKMANVACLGVLTRFTRLFLVGFYMSELDGHGVGMYLDYPRWDWDWDWHWALFFFCFFCLDVV